MKRIHKSKDGFYHIHGQKFKLLEGSRAQVWHRSAYRTAGGLTRDKLAYNKWGRVVSKRKMQQSKKDRRLEKAGYHTVKGKFGAVKVDKSRKTKKKR